MAKRVAINAEYMLMNNEEITWVSCRFRARESTSDDNIRLTMGIKIKRTRKDPMIAKKIVV